MFVNHLRESYGASSEPGRKQPQLQLKQKFAATPRSGPYACSDATVHHTITMLEPTPMEWVTVKTTLPAVPYPLLDGRPDIRTERLILRRTLESELDGWHALRLQPEVMKWTSQGHPDPDVEWSREQMKKRLAPLGDAKYEFVICVAETGEMIGTGGCHMVVGELGWPVIGYMLRKEFWGRGYATELVNGFLKAWWALPRAEVELQVEKSSVSAEGVADGRLVDECIVAVTLDSNAASQNVLRKCKLDLVKVWEEDDLRDPTQRAVLYAFVGRKPAAS